MEDALTRIFEAYRGQVAEARGTGRLTLPDRMQLALKIDVDTLRGTREGVPTLVELLRKHGVTATFLFSLGPDHTGRAIKRVFRPGFVGKVRRTSVVKHYGVQDAAVRHAAARPRHRPARGATSCAACATRPRDRHPLLGPHPLAGRRRPAPTTRGPTTEMHRACERYTEIFREPPRTHGAAGWQMNVHALRLTQRLGFDYCSDGRGTHPHLPVWNAEPIRCPQFPTTLPTLDELIGTDDITEDNVAAHLLERTRERRRGRPRVHAARGARRHAARAAFEQLLLGWKAQGWTLGPARALFEAVEPMALPRCTTGPGTVPGRTGTLLVQGRNSWPMSTRAGRLESVNTIGGDAMLGKKVADFTAPATGGTFKLSDHKGKTVVLYFYPKDNTPGCTTEGAQFRDAHKQFRKAGAIVVGCSRDSLKSHENFKAKMEFPFELITDADEKLCAAVRRHQDEEHVRQAGARHRAQHVRHRRRRQARARVARRQGGGPRRRGAGLRQDRCNARLSSSSDVQPGESDARCPLSTTTASGRFRGSDHKPLCPR